MCRECGCGINAEVQIDGTGSRTLPAVTSGPTPMADPAHDPHHHHHHHPHDHQQHHHHHDPGATHTPAAPATPDCRHEPLPSASPRTIELNRAILEENDRLAERNRSFFRSKGILLLNVLSSPGSGKTTLLQKTAEALRGRLRAGVIVGDLATQNDAMRLRASGVPVVQINTGTVCHLDADMIARAASKLDLAALDLVIIENVGNLVCPAMFDLGEELRVVLLSTTEGEDKPLKYPPMFHSAQVVVVTKTDLAEPAGFQREEALHNLARISHHARVFELSARSGVGMTAWADFLVSTRTEILGL